MGVLRLFVALAGGTLYLTGAWQGVLLDGDAAYYVGLARSLAGGGGYVFNGLENPLYPPGFPVVLVPAVTGEGWSVSAVTVYVTCWSLVSLLAVWAFMKRRGAPEAIALLCAASTTVFAEFTVVRSESVFVAILFLLLLVIERQDDSKGWWVVVTALVLSAATVAVRSIGVAVILAALLTMLWSATRAVARRRTATLSCGAALLGAAGFQLTWSTRVAGPGGDGSYLDLFLLQDPHQPDLGSATLSGIALRILENGGVQLTRAVELLTNLGGWSAFLFGTVQVAAAVLVGLGLRRELQRENPFAGWFLLSYVLVLILWPFDEGTRFMMPALPLLLLFGYEGVVEVVRYVNGNSMRWEAAAWTFAGLAAAVGCESLLRGLSRQGMLHVVLWLAAAILAGVLSRRPALLRPLEVRTITGLYAGAFLLVGAPQLVSVHQAHRRGEPLGSEAQIAGAIPWILENTAPASRIMATLGDAGLHLHSGRRTARLPITAAGGELWNAVDAFDPAYLVVPEPSPHPYYLPTGPERLAALRALRPEMLRLVYVYEMGEIYEVRRNARP